MLRTPQGETLRLWDTPGFGDSVRLLRRMQQSGNPLGWFLSQVWDRWRDRPFWASQQALRHVAETTDVVLYLVSAAEEPQAAAYVASEMALLRWVGKPVIVLLNQLGMPREHALEQAEVQRWREHLAPFEPVAQVLPLDAFARCWVQEGVLLQAIEQCLQGEQRALMQRLGAAWQRAAAGALPRRGRHAGAEHGAAGRGARRSWRCAGAALRPAQARRRAGPACRREQPGAAGPGGAGRGARRRGARQHHAADRAARPGGPGAGRDPAAHGQPLPADAAHGRKQGGADRRRAHRRAGRAEGRHRRRRADAGRRAARRRPARRARRRRPGARGEPGARHRHARGSPGTARRWTRC